MPTFDTPEPISADHRAGRRRRPDRRDRPHRHGRRGPAERRIHTSRTCAAAEQTRVEYTPGRPAGQGAASSAASACSASPGSVDVTIELPAGSQVDGDASVARVPTAPAGSASAGSRPSAGDIQLEETGPLEPAHRRRRRHRRPGRRATPRSPPGPGRVRLGEIDGTAVIKNSNGDSWIGEVAGDLRVNAANGDIAVDRAEAASTPRPPTATSGSATSARGVGLAQDRLRRDRGRHPRRHGRPARRRTPVRPGAQPDGRRRQPRAVRRDRRGARPHQLRRHRDPPRLESTRRRLPSTGEHDDDAMTATRPPAISVDRAAQVLRRPASCSTASTSTVAEGTIFALLGPNGAGKTTTVQILSTLIAADAGEVRVAGHDLASEPDAVRAAIGVTGQFSAVDDLLTGEENLHPDGRPAPPRPRRGPAPARPSCSSSSTWPTPPTKPAATYSGGHAAPARPGDDAGRRPAADLPRRADHRARPAQPPRPCGRSSASWSPSGVTIFLTTQYLDEADQLADRIARARPRPARRRGHRRRAQAPHPRRPHRAALRRPAPSSTSAATPLAAASRDDEALTLQVPGDGSVARRCAALLDRLDERRPSRSSELSVHTPDLDDVFFALTGQPETPQQKRATSR